MASMSSSHQEILNEKFEKWLVDKIKSSNSDQEELDVSVFINFILSALSEEDNEYEEKLEAIRPIVQEINQNNSFNEDELLKEIVDNWNKIKTEVEGDEQNKTRESSGPNPTDTILSMINKHKTHVVEMKKSDKRDDDEDEQAIGAVGGASYSHYNDESDSEDEASKSNKDNLFANTNLQEAMTRDKINREKMAESHAKQKEQSKKALEEQKQREIDKKKKAQQKAAKVERKR